jgi:hypothetical protein
MAIIATRVLKGHELFQNIINAVTRILERTSGQEGSPAIVYSMINKKLSDQGFKTGERWAIMTLANEKFMVQNGITDGRASSDDLEKAKAIINNFVLSKQ